MPVIYDRQTGRIVTDDYPQITLDLSTEWGRSDRLCPAELRAEIDEVDAVVYAEVNDGVHRCGFATTQAAYEAAYARLFTRLDRLADRRYLVGDTITEADVRLFTTLVRFDAVHHGHFKCNPTRIVPAGPDPAGWLTPRGRG